jgi:polyhydroxybutyrate depolymerase
VRTPKTVRAATAAASLAALAALTALAGCGAETGGATGTTPPPSAAGSPSPRVRTPVSPGPGDHEIYLEHDGAQRQALLHAPPGYRPGIPLVLALHGRPSSPSGVRDDSGLDATADVEGFLVAYPAGDNSAWNGLDCCAGPDDVGFLKALVADLVEGWGVDPTRVYATGFSAGANMAYRLAVEAPDVFAAIAPVSGGFFGGPADTDKTYRPRSPVPVVTILGEADRWAQTSLGGLERWRGNLRCTAGKPTWYDRGKTVSRVAATCADGSEVVAYTVTDMGHIWPGADDSLGIDANRVIWEFFDSHPGR